MAIPSVTCGADVELNYSAGTQNVSLSASGTGSPTSYAWTLLAVPVGSTALTETRGNFINGVSTTQNPSFVTDGAIAGSYIFQCIATNGDGTSSPNIDKENAQQIVFVKTQKFSLKIPNDYMWDWGSSLNTTLTTIETNIPTSFTASGITDFQPAVAGTVDVSANTAARHSHSNKSQLDLVSDGDHDIRTDNPHSVTSSQVGLGNVSNPTTKGDLITYSTTGSILPIGTNNQILTVDTSTSTGLKWMAASGIVASSNQWSYLSLTQPTEMSTPAIALYQFNGTASALNDRTGNNYTLTLSNGNAYYTQVDNLVGFFFMGSNRLYHNATPAALQLDREITVEIQLQCLRVNTAEEHFFSISGTNEVLKENELCQLSRAANTGILTQFVEYGLGTNSAASSTLSLTNNGIVLLTFTRASNGLNGKFYINGSSVSDCVLTNAAGKDGSDNLQKLWIGNTTFIGNIFSLKVTPAEFSAAQVFESYQRIRGQI